ncbi:lipoprotein NlpI [Vibrio palustris]|uniref:Lipoprotein NlpI n=1 Tax=Vibrio palustris TaxID=1918946 RepID=A0A1R4B8T5_9VIBR|nr:lipoprotein NlpI [Vibrio palustris]SJL85316.1 Lipoprotein NlpI precursor [Vibrio palustris]
MKWFRTLAVSAAMALVAGCAQQSASKTQWIYAPMAIPLQNSVKDEVQIARLSELLQRQDISDNVRSRMLNQRGNAYDNVGLQDLARLDFVKSIAINPKQPAVFNMLGVFYTGVNKHDAAYDAFDSALDLDPKNAFALRNRAVALYYGERPELGLEDMGKLAKQQPHDPFNALWVYFMQYQQDAQQAKKNLLNEYSVHNEQWGWNLVALTLHEMTEEQVIKAILDSTHDNELLAQRLTETYFYLGKRYQLEGQYAHALSLFKLAISLNVHEYVEYRYSFLELENIYKHLRRVHAAQHAAKQK